MVSSFRSSAAIAALPVNVLSALLVALLGTVWINTSHAQGDIPADDRLDPNCANTLMLNEAEGTPKKRQAHGLEFHVYPETVPSDFTGCQIVWLENGHKLITKHYTRGRLTWARGQEPKDVQSLFCLYDDGGLNEGLSFNLKRCPKRGEGFD